MSTYERKHTYMRFPGGKPKALTLSYDDGVHQDIRLMEIMDRHGLKGTFNINSGLFAPEGTVYPEGQIHRRLTKSEATALYANSGHEVAVHGYLHPFLDQLPQALATYDVLRDREALEEQFGRIIRGMAYPQGTFSDAVVESLRACGIAYARTTVATEKFKIPTDWLRMPATCHHKHPKLMELATTFVEKESYPPTLFYLWGHSYEFDINQNWNVIEEFAEFMGGREEIWYATNIEIYEYVQDYQRLEFSVRGDRIYNPSARTLWIFLGKEKGVISIAPGETILLED